MSISRTLVRRVHESRIHANEGPRLDPRTLIGIEAVAQSLTQLGYPVSLALAIGLIELICIAVYVIPRTSFLGAVLLTGYLGGAVATHVRISSPLFSHVLFQICIGLLIWGGLYLRDSRLRELVLLRR